MRAEDDDRVVRAQRELVEEGLARGAVEIGGRLVADKDGRARRERHCCEELLLRAPREVTKALGAARRQIEAEALRLCPYVLVVEAAKRGEGAHDLGHRRVDR